MAWYSLASTQRRVSPPPTLSSFLMETGPLMVQLDPMTGSLVLPVSPSGSLNRPLFEEYCSDG